MPGNLVAERRTTDNTSSWLYYLYGVDGIAGFRYNNTTYLFRKNIQGDVTHVYTESGTLVGQYAYDAWGNCAILQDTNGIATLNPFRYRGYYFDQENDLYYLQSRYYDPETCRFVNADDISYLDPETIGGLNLYAYCGNNPVMSVDPEGTAWWNWLISGLQVALGIALIATGLGVGLGASLLVSGTMGIISEVFGSQIGGGIGSIVNGHGAISTGISLFSFGWIGAILGTALVIIGGATALMGVNEVFSAFSNKNQIRSLIGENVYDGLYLGLNIASSVGTIVGRLGMRSVGTKTGRVTGKTTPYAKITDGYKTVQYDGRGKLYWSIHRTNHGNVQISNPHWHTGAGRDSNHFKSYIRLIIHLIFRR